MQQQSGKKKAGRGMYVCVYVFFLCIIY